MLPNKVQLMLLYGKRQPSENGPGFTNVPTEEVYKAGMTELDLMEMPSSLFDGVDGKNCVFMTTEFEHAVGIYKGRQK